VVCEYCSESEMGVEQEGEWSLWLEKWRTGSTGNDDILILERATAEGPGFQVDFVSVTLRLRCGVA
jgi:hypothetical protein